MKFFLLLCLLALSLSAQENYEIQTYAADTMDKGKTMIELHSNFAFQGQKKSVEGQRPTNHALRETLEITHGFNDWFETGFYVFTSYNPGYGYQWVGDHIRPRVRIPEAWKWPVGLSLSGEIGYQRASHSPDTWSVEIRPIVDKDIGRLYIAFNPTFGRALHGPGVRDGFVFSPNVKASVKTIKKAALGFEYYGGLGPVGRFDPYVEQEHQFIPTIDLDLGDKWEFNFGVGVGVTRNTEHLLVKMIIGRKVSFFAKK